MGLKSEITILSETARRDKEELYKEKEDLALQRREILTKKKELRKSVNKLVERCEQLEKEKVEISSILDSSISVYNDFVDQIINFSLRFYSGHTDSVLNNAIHRNAIHINYLINISGTVDTKVDDLIWILSQKELNISNWNSSPVLRQQAL